MPEVLVNLTDEVFARLNKSAQRHQRSIEIEAQDSIEQALQMRKIQAQRRLNNARTLRAKTAHYLMTDDELVNLRRDGQQ